MPFVLIRFHLKDIDFYGFILKRKPNFFTEDIRFLHVAPELCFMDRFEKMSNLDWITADLVSPLAKSKNGSTQHPIWR